MAQLGVIFMSSSYFVSPLPSVLTPRYSDSLHIITNDLMFHITEIDTYFAMDTVGSYYDATDNCAASGSSVASIHSDKDLYKAGMKCREVSYLLPGDFIGEQDGCWVGLSDTVKEGDYLWSDGSVSNYGFIGNDSTQPTTGIFPWDSSQPNNNGGADHVWINILKDWAWTDSGAEWQQTSNMFPLCNKPNPIKQCLNHGHTIHAWYDGSSIDIEYDLWTDKSGNNNNGIIVDDNGIELFDGSNISNSELYLNGQPIVIGTPNTKIRFNVALERIHTVFNLCKYRSDPALQRLRILTAVTDNGLFGFWSGLSGQAFGM